MKRFFNLALAALAMVAVALLSAFLAMRLAIHGREVEVPNLAGLTVLEADNLATSKGFALTLENRFYSTDVPAGHILAQDPAPGAHVRREWQVRITESLGPQQVSIPDLTGQSERAASVTIRRLSLDLGAVAHLALPGDPGVVVGQTPPPNSGAVTGPRVSLLISDPIPTDDPKSPATPGNALDLEPSFNPNASDAPAAYVMPALVGLTYSTAAARTAAIGLHLSIATAPDTPSTAPNIPDGSTATPTPAPSVPSDTSAHPTSASIITAQTPQPGRRVLRGDAVHITLARPATPNPTAATQ